MLILSLDEHMYNEGFIKTTGHQPTDYRSTDPPTTYPRTYVKIEVKIEDQILSMFCIL